jgi:uncharacterized repeat protein (TIGR01451 family)
MPYALSSWKLCRGAAYGVLAAIALAICGCSTSEPPQQYSSNAVTSNLSTPVQASDMSRAPAAPQEAPNAMAFPTGNRNTSDLLVEQIGPSEVRLGQPYSYQLRVTNLTNRPVTGVVLHQRVPDNLQISSQAGSDQQSGAAPATQPTTQPSGTVAISGGEAQFTVGDLGPHEARTIPVSGTPTREGRIDSCLTVQYNPPALCTMVNVTNPQLRVTVEAPSQADICQELVYKYTVTNSGTGTARDVALQANLPDGLQTADGQHTITANLGDLQQGQSKQVTARLRAQQAGQFSSQATVRSQGEQNVQSDPVSTTLQAPKLAVDVKGPQQEYLGEPIAYTVSVTNNGDAPAAATSLRLTPSGQAQFVSATGPDNTALNNAGGGVDLGTIAPGQNRQVNVTFKGQSGGALRINATASANCAQSVTGSAETQIQTLPALLLEAVDEHDPVHVGTNVVYDIRVTNQGTAPDHNVKVTVNLPESEQFVGGSGASDVSANGQTLNMGTVETIQPKQTVTWRVEVKATKPDDARFKVNMTSQSLTKPATKEEPTRLY